MSKTHLGLALGLVAAFAPTAHAWLYQRSFSQNNKGVTGGGAGREVIVHWNKTIKVEMHNFAGNVGSGATATAINATSVRSIITTALGQWTGTLLSTSPANMMLDLSSSQPYTNSSGCETTASGDIDGVNNIVFTSKATSNCTDILADTGTSAGIIGLTRVRYAVASGEIVEADMQLHDTKFLFLSSGSNNLGSNPVQINMPDVMTHELGHFFGLDHSPVRRATMTYAIADGLATADTDDQSGLLALYPPTSASSSLARLQGSATEGGASAFGAQVHILNARTLDVEQTVPTDVNGAFDTCNSVMAGPKVFFINRYKPFVASGTYYIGAGDGSTPTGSDGGCTNPGCQVVTSTLTYSWNSTSVGSGSSGGLSLLTLQATAGSTSSYLNLAGNSSETTLTSPPNTAATQNTLELDKPRVTRVTQTTAALSGGDAFGDNWFWITAPAGGKINISTAALKIYSRLSLALTMYLSDGTTPYGSCSSVVADVTNAVDPSLTCTGMTPGNVYKLKVTGTSVSCALIAGNSTSCTSASVGETTSTAIPYYIISAYTPDVSSATVSATGSLAASSGAGSSYAGMPACASGGYTGDTSGGNSSGACCGTLGSRLPGGPQGPPSLLLAVLLSPLTWFALWWMGRRLRGQLSA